MRFLHFVLWVSFVPLATVGVHANPPASAAGSANPGLHSLSPAHTPIAHANRAYSVPLQTSSTSVGRLRLRSGTALVIAQDNDQTLYAKNTQAPMPIASITKLMTAMVILDASLPMDEEVTITSGDKDRLR